jgi:hypothetical protein
LKQIRYAGKFIICLNSSQRRNSADSGDFLAINSFFALAEKISEVSNETLPAIRGILDHLRGQQDAQYLSKAQIVAVLFDILNKIFSRAFALVANTPTIALRPILRNTLLAALVVPTELNTALHQVRLANKDRDEARLEERQLGYESRMLAMEKRMNANVNVARAPRPTGCHGGSDWPYHTS